MNQAPIVGGTPIEPEPGIVQGALVDVDGERFYRVSNYDAMPPFLMSLVSDSDHWLFIARNGALTAGPQQSRPRALPLLHRRPHPRQPGARPARKTLLRVARDGTTSLWEPFSQRYEGLYRVSRNLYKSVFGNKIIFEEVERGPRL